MNREKAIAAAATVIYVGALVWLFAGNALKPRDVDHPVVLRNDRSQPVTLRLTGTDGLAYVRVAGGAQAPFALPSSIGGLRELDGCGLRDAMLFDGTSSTDWSSMTMLVVSADGSLAYLRPDDLAIWYATRPTLPPASVELVATCDG